MTNLFPVMTDSPAKLEKAGMTDICAAIGIFDGVHAGHRRVLRELVRMSEALGSVPVVITFSPHPREVLDPASAPSLLLPPEVKARLLAECGIRAVVTIPFTRELAETEAETFLDLCMTRNRIRLRGLCVGQRFCCGHGGKGTSSVLGAWAASKGIAFSAVPEMILNGETVSSSAIRKAAAEGNLEKVLALRTRPHALYGTVEKGFGVAGTELRTPTANLRLEYGVLPPRGVYAARSSVLSGKWAFTSVVNIGIAPTYKRQGTQSDRIEIHLLDFEGDLYGRTLSVELLAWLRPEKCFSSPDDLKKQIESDIARVRVLAESRINGPKKEI